MKPFEHYIYILECGDGSLYTTDVEARVSAHQAGTGAKYTKSHAPVRLIAQARFYSKERAMSAEAHFKQLDRAQKDALLAKANDAPLEDTSFLGSAKTPLANSSAAAWKRMSIWITALSILDSYQMWIPRPSQAFERPHFAR